jgi:uncharacterized protein YndB with AHSA1/START domain
MTGNPRVRGDLRAERGAGVVRIEDTYDTDAPDLWSAITDPDRLARWWGRVEGDRRPGGELRLFVESAQVESTGHIELCDPPRRLRVTSRETDESRGPDAPPFDSVIDVTLIPAGDRTTLVVEISGLPLTKAAYYGAGWQIHTENLAAYVAGRPPAPEEPRFGELVPPYLEMAARLG